MNSAVLQERDEALEARAADKELEALHGDMRCVDALDWCEAFTELGKRRSASSGGRRTIRMTVDERGLAGIFTLLAHWPRIRWATEDPPEPEFLIGTVGLYVWRRELQLPQDGE